MSNIKVLVQDANNVLLEVTPVPIQQIAIDRGVAGRGVTDVTAIEIDNALYLEFTFSDGTTEIVGPVGTIQYIGQAPIVVTGSTISLNTVPIAKGGTGQITANAGFNALAPSQTGNNGKYLKTDGTNTSWEVNPLGTVTSVDASGGTTGLSFTGGPITTSGTLTLSGTLDLDNGGTGATTASGARTNLNAADQATTISAGTGLSGGGDLSANRTLSIANTTVTAAAYGAASNTLTATVNAQGQLTALAATPIAISNTQISGLGTMSTQNANAVAITGGSITGITDLAVADGGTGASDAAGARTNLNAADQATTITAGTGLTGGGDLSANRTLAIANTGVTAAAYGSAANTLTTTVNAQGQLTVLAAVPIAIANTQVSGLGTMSTQNSNAVTITGGSITGITDLAIADGGTGASNAPDARSNLGLGTAAVLNAGVALGVATLDAGGTVPLSQIPASIQGGVSYQGAWNASTNTPTLVSSVGSKGYYYVVSVAGNTNLNGVTDWLVGDWAIYNGTAWEKIDNTDQVASVNGYTGVVVLTNTDVGAPPTSLTISAGTGLTGGGNLTTNRTISIANTTVTAAPYGTASAVSTFTVNGQGQLTAASDVTIAIANTQVSGLGTMSTQNANSVAITGGSITGITDLAIADGGTGASTAGGALTNLGAIGTITSADGSIVVTPSGTTVDLAVSAASPASTLLTQVRNTTGATLTKGTVVYISGATGQIATVSKAIATGDATSAQTLGMITTNLANNTNGYVTVFGLLENMDTSAYTDGAQLYLSGTVAGAVTATKPSAPIHLVYVAVVEYAHPTQGKLLVKVQNGYELDEIHDVSIVTPVTGQTLIYNSATDLWVNNTVSLTAGVNGTLPILNGGTGQTTANAAFNALAPSQTGNSGKYLTTDGTNTSWGTNPLGTVTSVAATVPSFLSISGSPITTSGTLAFGLSGTALPTTSGGTGLTSFTSGGALYATSTSALTTGTLPVASGGTARTSYTANSVLFASATNVIASSSNITFDGTNGFAFGTSGSTASATSLTLNGTDNAASGSYILGKRNGTNAWLIGDTASALGTGTGFVNYNYGTAPWIWYLQTGAEQMRLTSTGLGIGNSPSAWIAYKVLQIGAGTADGSLSSAGDDTNIATNAFYGTGAIWKYQSAFKASRYQQSGGIHSWYTAGTGTIGGTITFTQAMTLTASGELLVGTTSSDGSRLRVYGSYQTLGDGAYEGLIGKASAIVSGGGVGDFAIRSAANLVFATNGNTERVRITSAGNTLIGTTTNTNTSLLVVNGTISQTVGGTQYLVVDQSDIGTGANEIPLNQYLGNLAYEDNTNLPSVGVGAGTAALPSIFNATDNDTGFWFPAANTLAASTGGSERLRVDSSGNFLLGTTSNSSSFRLRVNATGTALAIFDGAEYAQTIFKGGTQQCYIQNYNSVSVLGTVGATPLTFGTNDVERVRISATGRVSIGTAVADSILTIYSSAATSTTPFANNLLQIRANGGSADGTIQFTDTALYNSYIGAGGGSLYFATNGTTERARIDSSGNLLVGLTSSNNGKISLAVASGGGWFSSKTGASTENLFGSDGSGNASIYTTGGTHTINFYTNGAERARISSAGNFLVGTTSVFSNARVTVSTSATDGIACTQATAGGYCFLSNALTNGGTFYHASFGENGTQRGSITSNGTVTTYNTTSDYRLKNNQAPLTGSGAFIDALQPKTWNWAQDGSKGVGFIAHEFAEVSPSSVTGAKDAIDAEGNPVHQAMQASSAEVIANLVAELQSLRQRVAQLEG